MFLRQSTSQAIRFGPFVDETDGVSPEIGLTIAQADMQISKDGAAFAAKNAAGNATHDTDGWYTTTLDTTDTATVGEFIMQVNVSGALPVWVRYWVLEEGVYDGLYAAAAAGFDASGYVAGVQGTINTLDGLDTAQDSQHAQTQSDIATVDTNVDAILVDTNELQTDWVDGGRLDLILDARASQTSVDNLNNLSAAEVNAEVDTALTDYDPPTRAELTTDVNSILSKLLKYFQLLFRKDAAIATDNATELTAVNADGGSGPGAYDNTTESAEAIRDRGDAAWITATGFSTLDAAGVRSAVGLAAPNLDTQLDAIPTAAENRTEMDSNSTQLAAIVADTNELQGDWVDGGRLDLILDARSSQTTADAIETDTQDIQSRLPAALVSGKMDSDATSISGSATAADRLEASALTIVSGAAEAGTLSTTQMTTDLAEATDDHYNGRIIIWTSGVLQNQATDITDYAGATGLLTYTAVTEAPSAGNTFIII